MGAVAAQPPAAGGRCHGVQPLDGAITMNNVIYIVGLVVVVLAVLAFFGLR